MIAGLKFAFLGLVRRFSVNRARRVDSGGIGLDLELLERAGGSIVALNRGRGLQQPHDNAIAERPGGSNEYRYRGSLSRYYAAIGKSRHYRMLPRPHRETQRAMTM